MVFQNRNEEVGMGRQHCEIRESVVPILCKIQECFPRRCREVSSSAPN